jgi:oligopeptide/dipeptide ABC transporter ATP-binding protein
MTQALVPNVVAISTQTADPLLSVRHLSKHFPIPGSDKFVQACQDVSLELYPGETLGIVGESGSGKTTLGRCILRLIEPTSAEIVFEGRDLLTLTKHEHRQRRKIMQIVFQEPFDSLNPFHSIGYQIAEPLRIHTKLSKGERRERVLELLKLVGLPTGIAEAVPEGLSPGTLQRCSIARALATEARLVVLDEPTSALPPEAEADIIRLLTELQERLGLSYLFISHDLVLVRQFCERVVVMYLGQIVEAASREELFAHPRHPYSKALLASALIPDPRRRRVAADRVERLEGEIPSPVDLPKGCYLASRCRYVRDRCKSEPQELLPIADEHLVRCWRVREGELDEDTLASAT